MTREVVNAEAALDPTKTRTFSMVSTIRANSLKLPEAAVRDVGPAAQTLGGILKLSLTSTFAATDKIASASLLPVKTVRKHLLTLQEHGWITNNGREPARSGRARRTCTIRTTVKTQEAVKKYYPLLLWTALTPVGKQWCSRVLWAVVVRRWLELRVGIINTFCDRPFQEHELPKHLDSVGGNDRFEFSLSKLQEMTGLSRDSIITGKRILTEVGFIKWRRRAGFHSPDLLIPNWDLRVIAEDVRNGRGRIHLRPG